MAIGAHIDSAFKEMARYEFEDSSENDLCKEILGRASAKQGIVKSAVKIFDDIYNITTKKVMFKCLPERKPIKPFGGEQLEWWDFYNDVKHEVRFNLRKANLRNVRDSLAGAFLLNVIHIPGTIRLRNYGVIKEKYEVPDWQFEEQVKKHKRVLAVASTPIFIYDFEQKACAPLRT